MAPRAGLKDPEAEAELEAQQRVIVETEFLLDFLTTEVSPCALRRVMCKAICYTTVVQISEVLELSDSPAKMDSAIALLSMIRPLGLPARYAGSIAFYLRKLSGYELPEALRFAQTASISQYSKVPVLTVQHESLYSRLDIPTIKPDSVR